MFDEELRAARERRVGITLLHVIAEWDESLVGFRLGSLGNSPRVDSEALPAVVALLADVFEAGIRRDGPGDGAVPDHLIGEVFLVEEDALLREVFVGVGRVSLDAARVGVGLDTAGTGALLHLFRDSPVGLPLIHALSGRFDRLVTEGEVHDVGGGDSEADLLVPLGTGKDVVGVEGGRAHPDFESRDAGELWPEVLKQHLAPAARAPEHVAAHLDDDASRLVLAGEVNAVPPAAVGGFLEVLGKRPLHAGVMPVRLLPCLLVACVVVPPEDGRDEPG